jgi:hypothetical protein
VYILCELDGSVLDRPIAAFHIIPYLAHIEIPLLPLTDLIDITTDRLCELEATALDDVDEPLNDEDH